MKRLAFILAILSVSRPAASDPWISFGVKAGLYTSTTTEIPAGWRSTSFRTGFAGGVYMDYAFSRFFSLQPEILYVMKGLDGRVANPVIDVNYSAQFDYIEIPILARFTLTGKSRCIPYVLVGPGIGINLAANLDIDYANLRTNESLSGSSDWSAIMNKTEFTFSFGGGCKYAIGLGGITADARFDLGLSKVYSGGEVIRELGGTETTDVIYAGTSKNLGFSLLVGYNF